MKGLCLRSNHLLVQTPNGNLSQCFRHIHVVYTQGFNRRNGHESPLFRGRYKALIFEADSSLLQLVRYVHRNPLEAGLAETLDDYPLRYHLSIVLSKIWTIWTFRQERAKGNGRTEQTRIIDIILLAFLFPIQYIMVILDKSIKPGEM